MPVEVIDVPMDFGFGLTPEGDREVARRVASDLRARTEEIAWVGISLAAEVASHFPTATLRAEPFLGEHTVMAPAPGLELATTEHYQTTIAGLGAYTPLALDRLRHYLVFSLTPFLAAHPELTDCQNVVKLGNSLRRFSGDVTLTSMAMHYDKSKA